jgi:hypothetical protein
MTDCALAIRPGVVAGVAGAPGELGTDALLVETGFTVPEAVRFDPAADAPTQGLPGKGFRWELAAEWGTIGVVTVDMTAGGEPGVEGIGVFRSSVLDATMTGSLLWVSAVGGGASGG